MIPRQFRNLTSPESSRILENLALRSVTQHRETETASTVNVSKDHFQTNLDVPQFKPEESVLGVKSRSNQKEKKNADLFFVNRI
ncbi:hypothetical protein MTP99_018130 [Tenebrio molitor]|jgi:hypothetical protein|nr:hypothetical protein MTP99_018130 [Tenebrio molitor]